LLHPGGAIGERLQPVDALMHVGAKLPLVEIDTPMPDVLIEMNRKSFGIAGVIRDGHLVGVITDGDLRRHSDQLFTSRAGQVMTSDPKVVPEGAFAEDVLAILTEHRITALFVMAHDDPSRPIGLVHIHDFARARLA
jgi:arabinose-5-phosphate isomerase